MSIMASFIPTILAFLVGFLLKKAKLLNSADASSLLKVVFYAGSPALVYTSIIHSDISLTAIQLMIFAPIVVGITWFALMLFEGSNLLSLDKKTFAAMAIGVMVMNTGFLIPFVEAALGPDGLSRLMLLNTGNSLITFTLVYAFAVQHGQGQANQKMVMSKLLLAPPAWALVAALVVKFSGFSTPQQLMDTATFMARYVSPAIVLALGIKFVLQLRYFRLLFLGLSLRFLLGGLIGFGVVNVFRLTGLNAVIVLLASMAPIGFNSITFADLEDLDSKYAAAQVSAGLIIGLLLTPFLIQVLSQVYL